MFQESAKTPTGEIEYIYMTFVIQPFLLCSATEYNAYMHTSDLDEHYEADNDFRITNLCMKEHYEYITENVGPQKQMRIIELIKGLVTDFGTIVECKFDIVGKHSIRFKYSSDGTLINKKSYYPDTYRIKLKLLPSTGNQTDEFGKYVDNYFLSILPFYKRREPGLTDFTWILSHTIDQFPYLHDHKDFIVKQDGSESYPDRPPLCVGVWYESIFYS